MAKKTPQPRPPRLTVAALAQKVEDLECRLHGTHEFLLALRSQQARIDKGLEELLERRKELVAKWTNPPVPVDVKKGYDH